MGLLQMVKRLLKNRIFLIITIIWVCISIFHYTDIFIKDVKPITSPENNIVKRVDYAQELLNFFHEKNVFLTDIEILGEISMFRNGSHLELNFISFFNSNNVSIPSFGVFYNDLEKILEVRI